jgi:hypothetical protein
MKLLIAIMLACFWITLTSAIPSTTTSHWYIQATVCIGAASSCFIFLSIWDKLKRMR